MSKPFWCSLYNIRSTSRLPPCNVPERHTRNLHAMVHAAHDVLDGLDALNTTVAVEPPAPEPEREAPVPDWPLVRLESRVERAGGAVLHVEDELGRLPARLSRRSGVMPIASISGPWPQQWNRLRQPQQIVVPASTLAAHLGQDRRGR